MTAPVVMAWVPATASEGAAALPYPGEDPAAVEVVADRLFRAAQRLRLLTDELFDARSALTAAWNGATGRLGDTEVSRISTALDDGVGRLYRARGALLGAADRLSTLRSDIDALRTDWRRADGEARGATAAIRLTSDCTQLPDLHIIENSAVGRRDVAVARWQSAVARADAATAECAATLAATLSGPPVYRAGRGTVAPGLGEVLGTDALISDDVFRTGGVGALDDDARWAALGPSAQKLALVTAGTFPAADAAPALTAAWWGSRTWTEQQAVLRADPKVVGDADGLPAAVRNQANLVYMDHRERDVQAALDAGDPTLAGVQVGSASPTGGGTASDKAVAVAMALAGLRYEQTVITGLRAQLASKQDQPLFLLDVDTSRRGQAVVAIGNPDTADHVVTYVPGTGSDAAGLSGELDRVQAWADGTDEFTTDSVAAVAWLGYESPGWVTDAAFDSYADAAAPALDKFQRGLRVSHQGPASNNTVIAHSYGALPVAAAASGDRSLAADRIVLVGSTGLELDSVKDLHLDGVPAEEMFARVHAIRHDNDAIKWTGLAHEDTPYDPSFGAEVTVTDPVGAGIKVTGFTLEAVAMRIGWLVGGSLAAHGDYQAPGSIEQRVISSLIVGERIG